MQTFYFRDKKPSTVLRTLLSIGAKDPEDRIVREGKVVK